jgi:monoamine oxidase
MTVIVIGAGPAGLYAAEMLVEHGKEVLILEAADYVGGRAHNARFDGTEVEYGAGVGRHPHDRLLAAWMKKHNEPVEPSTTKTKYWEEGELSTDALDVSKEIKQFPIPTLSERRTHTFEAWMRAQFGAAYAKAFVFASGYDDYKKSDIVDTIQHYHFEDVAPTVKTFMVHWTSLTQRSANYLTKRGVRILFAERVQRIEPLGAEYAVHTTNSVYHGTQVVLAVPARPAEQIMRKSGYTRHADLMKHVKGQPFVRAYVQFSGPKNFIEKNVPTLLVCDGPFRKIICMSTRNRVYMIAYCDNYHTQFWKSLMGLSKTTMCTRIRTALTALFDTPFEVSDAIIYYHPVGTHYYSPLPSPYTTREAFIDDLVHVDTGVTLVGEAVSLNQGWTNGALESVVLNNVI